MFILVLRSSVDRCRNGSLLRALNRITVLKRLEQILSRINFS